MAPGWNRRAPHTKYGALERYPGRNQANPPKRARPVARTRTRAHMRALCGCVCVRVRYAMPPDEVGQLPRGRATPNSPSRSGFSISLRCLRHNDKFVAQQEIGMSVEVLECYEGRRVQHSHWCPGKHPRKSAYNCNCPSTAWGIVVRLTGDVVVRFSYQNGTISVEMPKFALSESKGGLPGDTVGGERLRGLTVRDFLMAYPKSVALLVMDALMGVDKVAVTSAVADQEELREARATRQLMLTDEERRNPRFWDGI